MLEATEIVRRARNSTEYHDATDKDSFLAGAMLAADLAAEIVQEETNSSPGMHNTSRLVLIRANIAGQMAAMEDLLQDFKDRNKTSFGAQRPSA